jgi:alpha-amylase/alpha-mannosidase (GH57 family)
MTRVALLWHMHQPFYEDLATGEHILPWVRLHAIKDYWGMVALLRGFPGVRVTVNLVPSLLVQLEAFARGEARDRHLELGLKPAEQLTDGERGFCVEQFFHAHRPRMIDPHPRYAELLAKRGNGSGLSARAQAGHYTVADLRDLQVWHKLVWIDPFYWDDDGRIRALVEKGRHYTEQDKQVLRDVELELLGRAVPEHRDARARGQVELATSPFYHPILPLLCDTDVYLRTHPGSRMPRVRFERPEDAREQLVRAVASHQRLFGEAPAGLWPSEGGVSDAMVPLVAQAGFQWMATDEAILARTLGRAITRDGRGHVEQPELLYKPWRVGQGRDTVACGFRDHALSDLIGFSYASWPAEAAADDMVGRLIEAGRRYRARTGGEATIFVVLDGENAWEHYAGQGRPFLRALYGRLGTHPELETVTMREACTAAADPIPSIFPGSWIDGNFSIWIGHADDQRAWTQLAEARRALDAPPPGVPDAALARAREELLIAEGSDWFWWYGDDHSSDHDVEFDELFRRHVGNVYRALDLPVPEDLFVTNITTALPASAIEPPTGFVTPTLDGDVTSYFEWVGAGCVEVHGRAGAMHQVSERQASVALVEYGFDLDHLYVRVDGTVPMRDLIGSGLALAVRFVEPPHVRLVVARGSHGAPAMRMLVRRASGAWEEAPGEGAAVAVGHIAELRVPFATLGVRAHDPVAFFLAVVHDDTEVERHPRLRPIEFDVPDLQFAAVNWTV